MGSGPLRQLGFIQKKERRQLSRNLRVKMTTSINKINSWKSGVLSAGEASAAPEESKTVELKSVFLTQDRRDRGDHLNSIN